MPSHRCAVHQKRRNPERQLKCCKGGFGQKMDDPEQDADANERGTCFMPRHGPRDGSIERQRRLSDQATGPTGYGWY
jgi:hypothetical protein